MNDYEGTLDIGPTLKGFKVHQLIKSAGGKLAVNRKDLYKITLMTGLNKFFCIDKEFVTKGSILFLAGPEISCTYEPIQSGSDGFNNLFSKEFYNPNTRTKNILKSPVFIMDKPYIFELTTKQYNFLSCIFRQMISEQNGTYIYKADLLRNYIDLIIFESLRLKPL